MTTLFAATRRTQQMIGREQEMKTIRQAVMADGAECRVVFILGKGGFGKTRLLQETLWRLGNPDARDDYRMTDSHRQKGWDWQDDRWIAANIVDLMDTRLHATNHFLRAVRDSLRRYEFTFISYDSAVTKFEQRMLDNVDYRLAHQSAQEAQDAFWQDYAAITASRRIVWAIDTAEQLTSLSSSWLLERDLLEPTQREFQAEQWLANAIRNGSLANTTLLLAGRGEEGKAFFETITKAAGDAGVRVTEIEAKPFDEPTIQKYFLDLSDQWRAEANKQDGQKEAGRIAEVMETLAQDNARIGVFHKLTGGQPVLLALFSDLILESRTMPAVLRRGGETALTTAAASPELLRWQLEDEVINVLFDVPNPQASQSQPTDSLRRDILLALVRARLGLDAEQLHYLIDNPARMDPGAWEQAASHDRIRQIKETMRDLKGLSIVKERPSLQSPANGNGNGHAQDKPLRLGLQDEIYRIFADHQAPHIHPGKPLNDYEREDRARLERICLQLNEAQRARYERAHKDEQAERADLYLALRNWAAHQREKRQGELRTMLEQEERDLEIALYDATPAHPRRARLDLGDYEVNRRMELRRQIRELDLEHMHYAFLLHPERELNDAYFDLADEFWRANDEDADINTQAEMVRTLYDPYAVRFMRWEKPRSALAERDEEPVDVLRRAAQQEDASRWIKRLALRRAYRDAIEFADKLEATITGLPDGPEKTSWQHTFVTGERACWVQFARILPGQGNEIQDAITKLERIAKGLEKLATTTVHDIAIPEKLERGFIGHPALTRVKRVLSVIYANIAYSHTQQGDFRQAVDYNAKALDHIRETGAQAHRATVLNNHSRALSEMGRGRALRLCLDALELRQKIGADAPIGLSHSTLGLIYNHLNNPDRAWVEASKAAVFFRRVEDPRGLGLALTQLGEALRRMAGQDQYGRTIPVTYEELFRAAEEALNEAADIFLNTDPTDEEKVAGKLKEPVRWIEVRIEKGCLQRDRVQAINRGKARGNWKSYYSQALALLNEAANEAHRTNLPRLELDARVNIAWTHYYAADFAKAEDAIQQAETLIPPKAWIGEATEPLPHPKDAASHYFYQQSKINSLRGRMALDVFRKWVEQVEEEMKAKHTGEDYKLLRPEIHKRVQRELKDDPHGLDQAANFLIKAIFHAQLFSPRSSALSAIYDNLYFYLKKFNVVELEAFNQQVSANALARRGKDLQMQLEDLGDLHEFFHESLGNVTAPNFSEVPA